MSDEKEILGASTIKAGDAPWSARYSSVEEIKKTGRQHLERCRTEFEEHGDFDALKDAVYVCGSFKLPPPEWLEAKLFEAIDHLADKPTKKGRQGRLSRPLERFRAKESIRLRHKLMSHLISEGKTKQEIAENVSNLLVRTPYHATAKTIGDNYRGIEEEGVTPLSERFEELFEIILFDYYVSEELLSDD